MVKDTTFGHQMFNSSVSCYDYDFNVDLNCINKLVIQVAPLWMEE